MAAPCDGGSEPHAGGAPSKCSCGSNNCAECGRRRMSTSSLPSSSSSCSLLSFDSYPVQDYDKTWRVFTATVKGFAIGAGLKGGLAIFAFLTRLRRRRLLPASKKVEMASISADMALALKETLRYGLFLGSFAGTFVTAKWRALLAGALAGPSMLLTGLDTQHTSLAIYIFMRATVLASRCGIKSKKFGHICKPLTWAHGDLFLMCLSSSQILSAYILKQDSLPLSYKSFLNKHGAKDSVILNGVREIASGLPVTKLEAIEKFYESNGVNIKLDPQMKIPCSIIHGNQGCVTHFLTFLLQAYKRALPVYLPVYLIPALIVHRQGLLKRPYTILWKGLFGTVRSSLFLSTLWTCILFRILKRCNIPMVAIGTFPTGLALAIEKKSRRIEISLYCLARAIESFFTCIADTGHLPHSKRFKRADVVVFSISTAIIMHCYAMERDVFRSKYLNVLDWVFGVPLSPYVATPRKNQRQNSADF
ncbi:mitochondrial import inner membrane translocase [Striga asiatica]|uniref:Mitochondrial import inner membrane translocase n=1 Tax=Striga asiatica TaxID=4170 RepID=A0A5A7R8D1_STRAF|nr:mitochondrial import inner membrane translocase [Striga asiatica]